MKARPALGEGRLPAATEFAAIGLTAATNVAANVSLPPSAYVPANLAAAGVICWFASHSGDSAADFGLAPGTLRSGVREGVKVAIPVVAVVLGAAAIPATRRFFADEQVVSGGGWAVAYEILLRIPLGTALAEELIFRGALLGMFRRRYSRSGAVALSSLMFGLWHVLPTLRQLPSNAASEVGDGGAMAHAGVVGGVVVATTVAGFGFAWLRDRKDSLATPVVVHAALNAAAYLSGRYLTKLLGF